MRLRILNNIQTENEGWRWTFWVLVVAVCQTICIGISKIAFTLTAYIT